MPDVFDAAPKVELHLHLEGAIPLDTLWTLIEGHGGDPSTPDISALRSRFAYRDFTHFIETWLWMTDYLRSEEDFTLAAEAVARELDRQKVVYAEASFSPTDFARHGLTPQQLAAAIRRGLDRVPGTRIVLNADLVRDTGPEHCGRTLDAILEVADDADVRGITIGGSEREYPPEQFASVYARAAAEGMRLTAHAGEAAGPASIRGALEALRVERIGHGVRAVEDAALLAHLVERQTPLEVCPTSNIRTGVAADWESHPIHTLLEVGANVTVNSDDPTFFSSSLADEFRRLAKGAAPGMETLTLAAIDASWLDGPDKAWLAGLVRAWWAERTAIRWAP